MSSLASSPRCVAVITLLLVAASGAHAGHVGEDAHADHAGENVQRSVLEKKLAKDLSSAHSVNKGWLCRYFLSVSGLILVLKY